MPIGVIVNALSVAVGGVVGALMGNKLKDDLKENLTMIFGLASMAMGINSIVLMENMPAVILAVILGTAIGLIIHLGNIINSGGRAMQKVIGRFASGGGTGMTEQEFQEQLLTVIVLFCASGTGIYGAMVSGMSGDHSILISKSVLDFFTAMIFACSMGMVIPFISIPQFVILMILFLFAGVIYPLTTPAMINDFKACGGIIMVATGFRLIKVKAFPTADMLPAMVLVMPFSWLWVTYIAPFLG